MKGSAAIGAAERLRRAAADPAAFSREIRERFGAIVRWNRRSKALIDPVLIEPPLSEGPLWGLTFVVKGTIEVAGLPLTFGLGGQARRPSRNAAIVDFLLERGAACFGTANLDPLALSASGSNPWFGDVANPSFPERAILGSSGGCAAAVLSGMIDFAIGTDFGGSVRAPAAASRCVGLKVASDALPREGSYFIDREHDSFGFFTRTPSDLLRVLESFDYAASSSAAKVRIIVPPRSELDGADETVTALLTDASARLPFPLIRPEFVFGATLSALGALRAASARARIAHYLERVGPTIPAASSRPTIPLSEEEAVAATHADRSIGELRESLRSRFDDEVLFLLPSLGSPPPLRGAVDEESITRLLPLFPANLFGMEAVSVPLPGAAAFGESIQLTGFSSNSMVAALSAIASFSPDLLG